MQKNIFYKLPKLSPALVLSALLAACGGGGGDSGTGVPPVSGGQTPPPPTPPVVTTCPNISTNFPACDNFQATVPAPSYAPGSPELAAFNLLNEIRGKMGMGLLKQNGALDKAASNHVDYIMANYAEASSGKVDAATDTLYGHVEFIGNVGFTGSLPADRAITAGYTHKHAMEVVAFGQAKFDGIPDLINSVYHRNSLFGTAGADVGIKAVPGTQVAEISFSAPGKFQPVPIDLASGYPYDGMNNAELAFNASWERPNPMPDIDPVKYPFIGAPISMHIADGHILTVNNFTLSGPAGQVAVRKLDYNSDKNLSGSTAYLMPLLPLEPATRYTVNFDGADDGKRFSRTWSFTTRGSATGMSLSPAESSVDYQVVGSDDKAHRVSGEYSMRASEVLNIKIDVPSGRYIARTFGWVVGGAENSNPPIVDRGAGQLTIKPRLPVTGTSYIYIDVSDEVFPKYNKTIKVTVTP